MEEKIDIFQMEDRVDTVSLVKDVFKELWVILLFGISIGLFCQIWVEYTYVPKYKTQTTLVITHTGQGTIYENLSSAKLLAEQYKQVVESNILRKKITDELGLERFDAYTEVNVIPETNLVEISVVSNSAMKSFRILQSILENYSEVSVYVMEDIYIDVIQPAKVPAMPLNVMNSRSTIVKGFLVGCLIMLFAVLAISQMRDTVKNKKQAKEKLDTKYLGQVYHEKKKRSFFQKKNEYSKSMLTSNTFRSFSYVESYKMVASNVRSRMDSHKTKVLLVTSAIENEGKSTVAANLALLLAKENKKVLLIDGDLRKPSMYKIFEQDKASIVNYAEAFENNTPIGKMIQKSAYPNLYLMLNTKAYSSLEKLADKGTFSKIINICKEKMDYIIIDTSPIALVADTEELARTADASIIVVRRDIVLAKDINDAVDALNNTGARVMGCIFNDARDSILGITGNRGYKYGGYYGTGEK